MVLKLLFTLTNYVQALIEPGTQALVYGAAVYSNVTTTRIKTIGKELIKERSDLRLVRNSYKEKHKTFGRNINMHFP
jgi:hypothetical protein